MDTRQDVDAALPVALQVAQSVHAPSGGLGCCEFYTNSRHCRGTLLYCIYRRRLEPLQRFRHRARCSGLSSSQ